MEFYEISIPEPSDFKMFKCSSSGKLKAVKVLILTVDFYIK